MINLFSNIRNPIFLKNGNVKLNVVIEGIGDVDFVAAKNDVEPHGVEIYNRAMAGEFGVIANYVESEKTPGQIKAEKIAALNVATVVVDGMVFDAGEDSQKRMVAAILAAETLGMKESPWKLADNSVVTVTLQQLRMAQALAIQLVGKAILG